MATNNVKLNIKYGNKSSLPTTKTDGTLYVATKDNNKAELHVDLDGKRYLISDPNLNGGTSAVNDTKVIGGITVSGNTITASQKTLTAGTNISITGGADKITFNVPTASSTTAGATIVYTADKCTTYTSDSGTCTPLAVQNAAKKFAITRPTSSTTDAIARYSNTTGDVKDSTIKIEDVTNTKDTTQKAQVISIPAANGKKKMVYGYCTDQVDGTSFIGGLFDASDTEFPYASGLAIGGSTGNLLWKGNKVVVSSDIPTSLKNPNSLTIQGNGTTLTNGTYDGSAAKTVNITPSAIGAAPSSHNHAAGNITSGTLAIARGGTGITSNPSMLVNLASTSADTVFEASPRPGVTGTLPIANGGTGATSAANALKNLGLTSTATVLNGLDGRVTKIETEGVSVGDTLPLESQFYWDKDEEIPDGYVEATPPFSNPNLLINGDFQVWQRGDSIDNSEGVSKYTADRWIAYFKANITKSDTKGLKTVATGVDYGPIMQYIEVPKNMLNRYIGSTLTLSVRLKTNRVRNGYIGFLRQSKNIITSTEWTTYTFTTTISEIDLAQITDGTWILRVYAFGVKEENANVVGDTVEVEWVKLEQGSIATPFVPRPIADELAMCKRYFQAIRTVAPLLYEYGNTGSYSYLTAFEFDEMRAAPTIQYCTFGYNNASGVYLLNESYKSIVVSHPSRLTVITNDFNTRPYTYCFGMEIFASLDAEIY